MEDESQKEEEGNEWEDERDNSERKDEEKEKSREWGDGSRWLILRSQQR